jgi:hypothetical protein
MSSSSSCIMSTTTTAICKEAFGLYRHTYKMFAYIPPHALLPLLHYPHTFPFSFVNLLFSPMCKPSAFPMFRLFCAFVIVKRQHHLMPTHVFDRRPERGREGEKRGCVCMFVIVKRQRHVEVTQVFSRRLCVLERGDGGIRKGGGECECVYVCVCVYRILHSNVFVLVCVCVCVREKARARESMPNL